MAKGFTLTCYPWVYKAKYQEGNSWKEVYEEKPHKTPSEEEALSEEERTLLIEQRNSHPDLPLVNYTTQYGMGCFEGAKAFPQKDGSLKLFRPDENARRMASSMEGLMMPVFPAEKLLKAMLETVRKNADIGFAPKYDSAWEKDNFLSGNAVYLRPFTYSEPGIGINLTKAPWVIIISTPVGAYFSPGNASATTTEMVRATPKGTGWIKCDSNYVIPTLAKNRAVADGFMEAIFLDANEHKYVEEGSSCNIFFLQKNGTLVTPELGDTILPGITRKSLIVLAKEKGLKVEERPIAIEEAMSESVEAFVTGTAAGLTYLDSITHKGKKAVFGDGKMGEVSTDLLHTLKGIQYGAVEDKHGWMFEA
ncbi:MAG: branched-chain-amino-acid transaminase [Spirochaetales bacterium]|nr:branched-chain-amino-acid transaminase [Spirochaetales bacterium]